MVKPTRSIGFSLLSHQKRGKKMGGFQNILFITMDFARIHRRGGLLCVGADWNPLQQSEEEGGGGG